MLARNRTSHTQLHTQHKSFELKSVALEPSSTAVHFSQNSKRLQICWGSAPSNNSRCEANLLKWIDFTHQKAKEPLLKTSRKIAICCPFDKTMEKNLWPQPKWFFYFFFSRHVFWLFCLFFFWTKDAQSASILKISTVLAEMHWFKAFSSVGTRMNKRFQITREVEHISFNQQKNHNCPKWDWSILCR